MRKQKPISLDELLEELQGQKTMQKDPNEVLLEDLFNESFMNKYSTCNSFEGFLVKGNFEVETKEDINNLDDELFDRHVARETSFASWTIMLDTATKEYAAQ